MGGGVITHICTVARLLQSARVTNRSARHKAHNYMREHNQSCVEDSTHWT
jgi:hypothetical protein